MVEIVKYAATGRRKSAVARISIVPGNGAVVVNERAFEHYFPREIDRRIILEPLSITNNKNKFDISAKLTGGGPTGQAGAFQLALARALSLCDADSKTSLKKANLLRRDPRMKERKKPGQKGARKKFKWVKR